MLPETPKEYYMENTDAINLMQAITKLLNVAMETVDYQPNALALEYTSAPGEAPNLKISCDGLSIAYNPETHQLANLYNELKLQYSVEGIERKFGLVTLCDDAVK